MRTNIRVLLAMALSVAAVSGFAENGNINTDRPDQSDGTYTVGKNTFQLEYGITLAKDVCMNNFMLRCGLTRTTEARLLLDVGGECGQKGVKPIGISIKQRVREQNKALPAITFVAYAGFEPLASPDFSGSGVPVEVKLAFENELSDRFSLGYNIGASDCFKNLNLTLAFGYSPFERASAFFEYFSTVSRMGMEHGLDAGVLFAITPQWQVDVACGCSSVGEDCDFFATTGMAYRF